MTKPRTRSTTAPSATAIAKELRARLDADDDDEHATLRAQVALWDRIRPTLAANDASVGLEALDALVVSVLAEDDELPPLLDRTVVIVPHPDASVRGVVPAHPLFSFVASPYHGKRPSARSGSKAAGPAKKKQRQLRRAPSILQNLPAHVSAKLRTDREQQEQAASELGTVVVRLAYRWCGQRAWYDPVAHRDLCLAHYRLVMQFRSVFLDCALYAPTTKANERRKQKLNAIVARFQFLSRNVELFGYYGFLRLIEKGAHDNLMWLVGKAAKHSASAKAAKADHDDEDVPAQEDLAIVLRTNPSRYKVIIGRILDPSRVDEDGYASIPELREQTHALDPARPEHLRLSNRALARVVLDVQGNDPPYPNWVDNTNRGDWKKLLASEDLQATIDEVEQLLVNDEPVAVFNQKRFQDTEKGEDESDYEVDGLPTIRPPTSRKTSASPTPKSAQKKKRVPSGLTESEASEGESSDAEPDDKPSDKTPKGSLYESSDDDDVEEEADSSTNDKADKEAAATPGSSAGPKTPSSGDDKSGGKGHDKGRDKNPRKTP
ncbi:hypothetical protein PF005_g392 [Phytophthora fragariae]|uniref:Uncharacterized protein n=1 Tax=Phytophthora fragariae TaxID=53985 RepID=A0A6A3G066_9STRA|nr:hypothetical protein PF009_g366 [Phytophthora fragariae]KAE9155844.1 hypothetical protein PF006_g268 [Phytophthora fragariae]KAE9238081.1 hypothetical protein PF005_g392 [Phytophthora fragariae]KAE9258270.1 hypothetical protein PF002_g267 [Phytophthora fragariae]KAE9315563.1 hypothetical protein PF001_g7736 [Phytophthora fragariae]